jgi:NACalpha-BTF3-like transcription factor
MSAHGSPEEYRRVLEKYCEPGIIRQAMGLLVIKNPYVVQTEMDGPLTCYTVEGTTVGTSSEMPADITQIYKVCWLNDRIFSLEFFGAKPSPRHVVIPEMQECMAAHSSKEAYAKALQKYCDPGIMRQAMALLVIKEPYVTMVEQDGASTFYTVQGRTVETSSEIPADTLQSYRVGWKGGRIVTLEFLGAVGGTQVQ